MFYNASVGNNGAIVGHHGIVWLPLAEGIVRHGTKKEVATGVTAEFSLIKVRGITIQVQHHVGSAVADFGIGTSHQIVEQFCDIIGILFGGLGFMGSGCAVGQKNYSITGTDIVEGNADDLSNVLDADGVEGLVEV